MPSDMQQNNMSAPGSKKLSADASEFIPQNFRIYSELNRTNPSTAVVEVQKAIRSLVDMPEEFYEVLVPLVKELNRLVQSPSILKAIVQEVFEMSISNSQFRYSGARMCSYMSQHLLLKADTGIFLTELVNRCLKEYESVSTAGGFQSMTHLIGFTLFMGELLDCMKDVEEIRKAFPERLEDLLMTLTSNQSPHAIRCVIQSLKLTGAILDELVPQAAELYVEIERFIDDSRIPESIQAQIKSFLDLRRREWEQSAEESKNYIESKTNGVVFLCDELGQEAWLDPVEPVYYGSNDGYLLDETEVLENLRLNGDDANNVNSNVEYLVDGEPMDPETALAFEMFIQQLPAIQNEQQLNEPSASGGHFVDPPWQMDGWSTAAPPSFTGSGDSGTMANNFPEYYGQNYDLNSYYLPVDNRPPFTLQPGIPQVVPVAVPPSQLVFQPLPYMSSVRVPCSERGVYEMPVAASLLNNPSSVNETVNGVRSQCLNPPFGR